MDENFDAVTAPSLPANWISTQSGGGSGWTTSTTTPDSAPNAAFAADVASVGLSHLETPVVAVGSASAVLKFRLNHNTETGFDGMVLDIKVGAANYQDILAAGGTFVAGPYTGPLSTGFENPLPGRQAWSGNSNGYKDVEVTLPASANGQNVQFRFTMGHDVSVAGVGVRIDNVQVLGERVCSTGGGSDVRSRADFDGDGRTDLSIFRPSEGNWYINGSTNGFGVINWGIPTDVIVPGDYDGDGKTDTAIFRATPNSGTPDFYILNSDGFVISGAEWGLPGDVPVVGDYDGDGRSDIAVFRPADNVWYILNSGGSGGTFTVFGDTGDTPLWPIGMDGKVT